MGLSWLPCATMNFAIGGRLKTVAPLLSFIRTMHVTVRTSLQSRSPSPTTRNVVAANRRVPLPQSSMCRTDDDLSRYRWHDPDGPAMVLSMITLDDATTAASKRSIVASEILHVHLRVVLSAAFLVARTGGGRVTR